MHQYNFAAAMNIFNTGSVTNLLLCMYVHCPPMLKPYGKPNPYLIIIPGAELGASFTSQVTRNCF